MKTQSVQLKGVSQEEEDARFQAIMDKKREELNAREAEIKKKTLAEIERGADPNPRRSAPQVRVERDQRQSGLRL